MKKQIMTITAIAMGAIALQSPAQASVNPMTFESNFTKVNSNFVKLDVGHQTVTQTPDATPVQVAWSVKGAYNKTKRAVKKTG